MYKENTLNVGYISDIGILEHAAIDNTTEINETLKNKRSKITKLVTEKSNNDKIKLKEAESKNLIFVGRTRSGKTTALKVLKSPYIFVNKSSIYSDTKDAKISHFTVEYVTDKDSKNYNINIIDTPGLFEVTRIGSTARDNAILEEIVMKCMNSEITKIHAVFFVISLEAGINPHDIEALQRFVKLFSGAEENIVILITRSETLTPEERNNKVSELKSHPQLSKLFELVGGKVFFTGTIEKRLFEKGFYDEFEDTLETVNSMRASLFNYIFNLQHSFSLGTLGVVDNIRAKTQEIVEKLSNRYIQNPKIEDDNDYDTLNKQLGEISEREPLLPSYDQQNARNLLNNWEPIINKYKNDIENRIINK